jgi:hypothetical protein
LGVADTKYRVRYGKAGFFWDTESLLDCFSLFIHFLIAYDHFIRWIYYPTHKIKITLFSNFLFTLTIFISLLLDENTQLEIGCAFGYLQYSLILRYRTLKVSVMEWLTFVSHHLVWCDQFTE